MGKVEKARAVMGCNQTAKMSRDAIAKGRRLAVASLIAVVALVAVPSAAISVAAAAEKNAKSAQARAESLAASTSEASRRDALRLIPLDKLSKEDRAKVEPVLANSSVFRRLPTRVVDCDPDLFLFLVRHPDVVVNIWEEFKVSRLQLRETAANRFRVTETTGTTTDFEYVYQSHDLHIIYGEGTYQGPLSVRPVKGRGVIVLKSGYVQETNDRYYITNRMDCFLTVDPVGAELATKAVSPLVGKVVDNNFIQTLSFVGSLSRTAEVNSRGVQRLASRLMNVTPENRERFAELAASMPDKYKTANEKVQKASAEVAQRQVEWK